jgi:hypothetical protein
VRGIELRKSTIEKDRLSLRETKDQLKRGHPSDYSAEIADTICNRLAGGESLRVSGKEKASG